MKIGAGTGAPPVEAVNEDFEQAWNEASAAAKMAIDAGEVPAPHEPTVATPEAPVAPPQAAAPEAPTEPEVEPEAEPAPGLETRLWRKREKQKLQEQFDNASDMLVQRAQRALAIEEAYKARDFDGLAKQLGKGSWSELIMEHLETEAQPERRDIARVGQEVSKLREELAAEKQALARAQQEARDQEEARLYYAEVQGELVTQKVVSEALAKDPEFIQAVVEIQRLHYDEAKDETIPAAQAAKIALDNLRKARARLAAYPDLTGEQTPATAVHPANGGAPGTQPAPKRAPTAIPQRQGADAAPSVPVEELSDKEWFSYFESELKKNRAEKRGVR